MTLLRRMLADITYTPTVDEAWDSNLRNAYEVESELFKEVWQHLPEGSGLLSQWSLPEDEREELRKTAKRIWATLDPLVLSRADEGGSGVYEVSIGYTSVGYLGAANIEEAKTVSFYLFQWLTNMSARGKRYQPDVKVRLLYGPGQEMLEVCLKKLDDRSRTSLQDSRKQVEHHTDEIEFWSAVRSMIHTGSV